MGDENSKGAGNRRRSITDDTTERMRKQMRTAYTKMAENEQELAKVKEEQRKKEETLKKQHDTLRKEVGPALPPPHPPLYLSTPRALLACQP